MTLNKATRLLLLATAAALPALSACAPETTENAEVEESSDGEPQTLPYLFTSWEALMPLVHNPAIRICISGTATNAANMPQRFTQVQSAISKWLLGISDASTKPLVSSSDIFLSCNQPDWTFRFWATPNPDPNNPLLPGISGIPYTEIYPLGDNVHVLLHEVGHLFGLLDTYNSLKPGTCLSNQPDSVMCEQSRSEQLMPDDVAGVLARYCRMYPQYCKLPQDPSPQGSQGSRGPQGPQGQQGPRITQTGGVTRNDGMRH